MNLSGCQNVNNNFYLVGAKYSILLSMVKTKHLPHTAYRRVFQTCLPNAKALTLFYCCEGNETVASRLWNKRVVISTNIDTTQHVFTLKSFVFRLTDEHKPFISINESKLSLLHAGWDIWSNTWKLLRWILKFVFVWLQCKLNQVNIFKYFYSDQKMYISRCFGNTLLCIDRIIRVQNSPFPCILSDPYYEIIWCLSEEGRRVLTPYLLYATLFKFNFSVSISVDPLNPKHACFMKGLHCICSFPCCWKAASRRQPPKWPNHDQQNTLNYYLLSSYSSWNGLKGSRNEQRWHKESKPDGQQNQREGVMFVRGSCCCFGYLEGSPIDLILADIG